MIPDKSSSSSERGSCISVNKCSSAYLLKIKCRYILVMQCFQVAYHGISHKLLVFSQYTYEPVGECVYQKNTSDKWDIPCYITRKC